MVCAFRAAPITLHTYTHTHQHTNTYIHTRRDRPLTTSTARDRPRTAGFDRSRSAGRPVGRLVGRSVGRDAAEPTRERPSNLRSARWTVCVRLVASRFYAEIIRAARCCTARDRACVSRLWRIERNTIHYNMRINISLQLCSYVRDGSV